LILYFEFNLLLLLYNLILGIYHNSIRLAAFFNPKAKQWVDGRHNWSTQLAQQFQPQQKVIWVHCASLGEFEQGRPIIEGIKSQFSDAQILLSFYSPSGFELRKDYPLADHVTYLPPDTLTNARQFIDLIQPSLVIFIKYEFWIHYLSELHRQKIPTLLASAVFRKEQLFFKPYGGLFRKILSTYHHIFVQDHNSASLLSDINMSPYTIAGDTRVDRVKRLAAQVKSFPIVEAFAKNNPVFIAGSTWPEDEQMIQTVMQKMIDQNWKFIFAPHEINARQITSFRKQLGIKSQCYSVAKKDGLDDSPVLIIDNIGMLSSLYQYGNIAYIGGGFGKGIHNILEPIVYGLPVIFGSKYQKFTEAVTLVQTKGAFTFQNQEELTTIIDQLSKDDFYQQSAKQARNYIDQNNGATQKILAYIDPILKNEF